MGISYQDHVSNEEVCKMFNEHIGLHTDLLAMVKQRNLKRYGGWEAKERETEERLAR